MGVFGAHTDPADLTDFLLIVENLTEALRFVVYVDSHRFREIQQEDYLWEFVVVCGIKKRLFNPLKIH